MNNSTDPTLRRRAATLLLPALLLLSAQACKKAAPAAEEKPTVAVEAVHPETGDITEDIEGDATLTPVAQASIASKVSAPIKKFYVQRGSRVGAGQLVAELESRDLAAAALDNKGSYVAAQGAYTVATQSTVPEEQTKARLDLEQAKATYALNKSIYDARAQLLKQGAIPGRDVDTARATMMQSQAALDIAQQHYDSLMKSSHKASIEIAQGQQDSAKGKFLQAEAQLSYTRLVSPIRGVVTERAQFAGDTATAGTSILTVMDTSTLIAKLHLAQDQVQQLQLGAAAKLQVPGVDEMVPATVSLISPALDPGSTTVEVWLKVNNAKGVLKVGTSVHAVIQGRTIHGALLVPSEAVQRSSEGGGKMVLVITADGTAKKRNVTVGIATKETTQIESGLSATDTVITGGSFGLDDGTKVKVEAAKKEGAADDEKGGAAKDGKPAPGEKE
jgi:HlyD family secretion protein